MDERLLGNLNEVLTFLQKEGFTEAYSTLVRELRAKAPLSETQVSEEVLELEEVPAASEEHPAVEVIREPVQETTAPAWKDDETVQDSTVSKVETPEVLSPKDPVVSPLRQTYKPPKIHHHQHHTWDCDVDEYECLDDVGYHRKDISYQQRFAEEELEINSEDGTEGNYFMHQPGDHLMYAEPLTESEETSSEPDDIAQGTSPFSGTSRDVSPKPADETWDFGPKDIKFAEPVSTPSRSPEKGEDSKPVLSRVESLSSSFKDFEMESEAANVDDDQMSTKLSENEYETEPEVIDFPVAVEQPFVSHEDVEFLRLSRMEHSRTSSMDVGAESLGVLSEAASSIQHARLTSLSLPTRADNKESGGFSFPVTPTPTAEEPDSRIFTSWPSVRSSMSHTSEIPMASDEDNSLQPAEYADDDYSRSKGVSRSASHTCLEFRDEEAMEFEYQGLLSSTRKAQRAIASCVTFGSPGAAASPPQERLSVAIKASCFTAFNLQRSLDLEEESSSPTAFPSASSPKASRAAATGFGSAEKHLLPEAPQDDDPSPRRGGWRNAEPLAIMVESFGRRVPLSLPPMLGELDTVGSATSLEVMDLDLEGLCAEQTLSSAPVKVRITCVENTADGADASRVIVRFVSAAESAGRLLEDGLVVMEAKKLSTGVVENEEEENITPRLGLQVTARDVEDALEIDAEERLGKLVSADTAEEPSSPTGGIVSPLPSYGSEQSSKAEAPAAAFGAEEEEKPPFGYFADEDEGQQAVGDGCTASSRLDTTAFQRLALIAKELAIAGEDLPEDFGEEPLSCNELVGSLNDACLLESFTTPGGVDADVDADDLDEAEMEREEAERALKLLGLAEAEDFLTAAVDDESYYEDVKRLLRQHRLLQEELGVKNDALTKQLYDKLFSAHGNLLDNNSNEGADEREEEEEEIDDDEEQEEEEELSEGESEGGEGEEEDGELAAAGGLGLRPPTKGASQKDVVAHAIHMDGEKDPWSAAASDIDPADLERRAFDAAVSPVRTEKAAAAAGSSLALPPQNLQQLHHHHHHHRGASSQSGQNAVVPPAEPYLPRYTIDEHGNILYEWDPEYLAANYEVFDLRVIHRRSRTGFEETKDFPIRMHDLIAGRYQVMDFLGSAAFSSAVQALDIKTGNLVCLKIIKNNKDYFDQSLDEIKLLKYVNGMDPTDEQSLVRLYDYFYYKEHLFLVCELLRANLYEFQKYNRESGDQPYFTNARIQRIVKQTLKSLAFLHSLGLVHSDLKPENILIKSYSRCEVKVIDLGSSCFITDHLSSYVQSRAYRAPEVILGLPYDFKVDIWSLGCIIAELSSGYVLFQNDSVATLLCRLEGILGPVPEWMLHRGRYTQRYYTRSGMLYDKSAQSRKYQLLVPKRTSLKHRVPDADEGLLDFITYLLNVDPRKRPTALEAMQHPWLQFEYPPF